MNEQRLSEDIERLLVARNLRHMEIARAALQPGYQPWPRQVQAVWRVLLELAVQTCNREGLILAEAV